MLQQLIEIGEQFKNCLTIADCNQKDMPMIYVNKKFTEMTGYQLDEIINKNCRFLQGESTNKSHVQFIREALLKEEACAIDLLNYKKDGTMFWNRLVLVPFYEKRNKYFIGLQHDITSAMQNKFNQKDLTKIKDAEICHSINNPLTVILTYSKELQEAEENNPEKINYYKEKIIKSLDKIGNFVINLEDLSKFENYNY